jgi:hypothetical protein
VGKEDLPKTWEDVVTNPRWKVGKRVVYRRTEDLVDVLPKVQKFWSDLWMQAGKGG